jgi:hypothetical protein
MAMEQQALLTEHSSNVRRLSYDDQVELRAALQRAKMLVRKIDPDETHYIEDIEKIRFYASFAPSEPDYDLQCWERGCEELASLLETIASQLDTFGVNTEQVQAVSWMAKRQRYRGEGAASSRASRSSSERMAKAPLRSTLAMEPPWGQEGWLRAATGSQPAQAVGPGSDPGGAFQSRFCGRLQRPGSVPGPRSLSVLPTPSPWAP